MDRRKKPQATNLVAALANFNPIILVGCDVNVAPIVPCLECGRDVPLTSFVLHTYVDGRAVPYCSCSHCTEQFADAIPYNDQTVEQRAANKLAMKRIHARRARLLRKHLHDRVMPVARALVTNVTALMRRGSVAA